VSSVALSRGSKIARVDVAGVDGILPVAVDASHDLSRLRAEQCRRALASAHADCSFYLKLRDARVVDARDSVETSCKWRDVLNGFKPSIARLPSGLELQSHRIARGFQYTVAFAHQSPVWRERVNAFARWAIVIFFTSHRHTGHEA
jgi:hypothetical protein